MAVLCWPLQMIGGLLLTIAFLKYQIYEILLKLQAVFRPVMFFAVIHSHLCLQ
jgi:hypothetical protein